MPRFQVPPLSDRKRNKDLSCSNSSNRMKRDNREEMAQNTTTPLSVVSMQKKNESFSRNTSSSNSTSSIIGISQGTKAIRSSIQKLHTSLVCSICQTIFQEPIATLASCTHSFCYACIYQHLSTPNNQTTCPICGFSVGVVGTQKVLQTNPQLESVVSSYQRLQRLVQHQLPPYWWKQQQSSTTKPASTTGLVDETSLSYPSDEDVPPKEEDSSMVILPTTQSTYETALESMVRFPYNFTSSPSTREEIITFNTCSTTNNDQTNTNEDTQLSQSTYDTAAESILRTNKTLQSSITISTSNSNLTSTAGKVNTNISKDSSTNTNHNLHTDKVANENTLSLQQGNDEVTATTTTTFLHQPRRRRTQSYGRRQRQKISPTSDPNENNPADAVVYISPSAVTAAASTEKEHSSVETKKTCHQTTKSAAKACSPYYFTTPTTNNGLHDIPNQLSLPKHSTASSTNTTKASPLTTPPDISAAAGICNTKIGNAEYALINTSNNNDDILHYSNSRRISHLEKLDSDTTNSLINQDSKSADIQGTDITGAVDTVVPADHPMIHSETLATNSCKIISPSYLCTAANANITMDVDLLLYHAKEQKLQYMCYGLTKEQVRSINTCARKGMLALSHVHLVDCLNESQETNDSSVLNLSLLSYENDQESSKRPLEINKSTPFAQALFSTTLPLLSICGVSEISTCDGDLVKRTFGYILSVAAGLPMVTPLWIMSCATQKKWIPITKTHSTKSDPTKRERRGNNVDNKTKAFEILGCTNASNGWMVPMKAQKARNMRLLEGKFGCGLLEGFTVLLCGEFDLQSQTKSNKSKQSLPSWNCYTKERVVTLLELCGAQVFDLVSEAAKCLSNEDKTLLTSRFPQFHDKSNPQPIIVMIRRAATAQDVEATEKYIRWLHGAPTTTEEFPIPPIVKVKWLIESIADFEVKPFT